MILRNGTTVTIAAIVHWTIEKTGHGLSFMVTKMLSRCTDDAAFEVLRHLRISSSLLEHLVIGGPNIKDQKLTQV